MAADLKELLAQKEALERQIEDTKRRQRDEAIAQIRELMAQYGLSPADIGARTAAKAARKAPSAPPAKVAAKYRNAETGETWSGRGLQPRWLKAALAQGRKLDDFKI